MKLLFNIKFIQNLKYVVMEVINLGTGFFRRDEIDYHISNFDTSNVKFMYSLIGTAIPTETAAATVTTFNYDISG